MVESTSPLCRYGKRNASNSVCDEREVTIVDHRIDRSFKGQLKAQYDLWQSRYFPRLFEQLAFREISLKQYQPPFAH